MDKERRSPPNNEQYKGAYSEDRLLEICMAFEEWYKTLPKPRSVIAASRIGCRKDTISVWLNQMLKKGTGISPYFMARLKDLTGNIAFDLLPQEVVVFKRRGLIDENNQPVRLDTVKVGAKRKKKTFNLDRTSIIDGLSEERKVEIRAAIADFRDNLKLPKTQSAKECGFEWRSTATWLKDRFPTLGSLIGLFHATGDKRFLLTESENKWIILRGIVLPEDYAEGKVVKQENKIKSHSELGKHQDVTLASVPCESAVRVVERNLLAIQASHHASCEMLKILKASGSVSLALRQQVWRLLIQIAEDFGLTGYELQEDVDPETDEATINMMEKLLHGTSLPTDDKER